MVWFFSNKDNNNDTTKLNDYSEQGEDHYHQAPFVPKEQDENLPMDLGTIQDIFSFSFIRGRPILNFFLAILWSIGLPILLYHLLLPHIHQVLAMIVASSPPLVIVLIRMFKEKTIDVLGIVSGLSFLITGIISIAQPDEKTSAICESIVPLLIGVFCLFSLIPLRIGHFELRPLIFQVANQVMPREEEDEQLQHYDQQRLSIKKTSKRQKLDYLYSNMSRFRNDMRVMTAWWGITLVATFIIKVIVVMTSTDISHAETVGYVVFGLATGLMIVFTWVYTKLVKKHVTESTKEGLSNATWGVQKMGNTFAKQYKALGDDVWKNKVEKINAELFTLTYGSMVLQLVKDYEDYNEVNKQLEKM
ncbi:uncharacterized protein BX664DRAFT_268419 [Halteromyces radiatus]|uniref:uncharacterized protein n=1 Tax=Halteromyces radiatus TaxID=101107 RepID=UPI002220BDCC|nr:uncharacterized protein BX664DRAFT_268419 [Halteromyces radiatus]KAI8081749.1 hypothetical protein BX664DRAFT_268419 [Halteromyces radiatus]